MRVVLAHAGAHLERLRRGGADAGRAPSVCHRLVDPVVDSIGQGKTPFGRGRKVVSRPQDCVVRLGERRWFEQVTVGEPAVGKPIRLRRPSLDRDLGDELDRVRHPRRKDVDDHVAEAIAALLEPRAVEPHRNVVPQPPLVAEALRRNDHEAVIQVPDRFGVLIAKRLAEQV